MWFRSGVSATFGSTGHQILQWHRKARVYMYSMSQSVTGAQSLFGERENLMRYDALHNTSNIIVQTAF